jgi:hypothetical protein
MRADLGMEQRWSADAFQARLTLTMSVQLLGVSPVKRG